MSIPCVPTACTRAEGVPGSSATCASRPVIPGHETTSESPSYLQFAAFWLSRNRGPRLSEATIHNLRAAVYGCPGKGAPMLRVGLTGGIGSGKSAVAERLAAL